MNNILLVTILIPAVAAVVVLLIRKANWFKELITLIVAISNLTILLPLFRQEIVYSVPWSGFGMNFSLRLDYFSSLILIAVACFTLLVSLYSVVSMRDKNYLNQFYAYILLTLSFANGALLADNLIALLFFWEGLLVTMFGMIAIGNKGAFKTAIKAAIIVGITDLCLMFGILLTGYLAGSFEISKINLAPSGLGAVAFVFLMIGAISKAGSMPFHSWIPDAALDAPLPFMAFLPAALEKLLGIYLLTRISVYMFKLSPGSWLSTLMMIIGAVTILFAVMMALVQKDYKKLLSYHAISQVGYMVLGIGTAVPAGIVGGLFHMINNAIYKSGLFLTGGAVEKQAGTTDLKKLGGLGMKMPVTFICFLITAASISGVPPFNGFFSKELLYDAALERSWIFYLAAITGSFFTAASFLKLGHAAFLGKIQEQNKQVKEAPATMLLPMAVLALICVLFGVFNTFPVKLLKPVLEGLGSAEASHPEFHINITLVLISVVILCGAFLNHLFGVKKTGNGLGAVDHIHHAPVLSGIYDKAEKRYFDPYDIGLRMVDFLSKILWGIDRGIDWVYNVFSVKFVYSITGFIKKLHNGNYSIYILWSVVGVAVMVIYAIK